MEAKLHARLGTFHLTAEIEGNGAICVAGKNGAGKSTLVKAIAGLVGLEDGYVKIGGVDVTRLSLEKKRVVLVTPDSAFLHMDVESHLRWGARIKGRNPPTAEIERVKSELGINFGGRVRTLSLGMRERVSLGSALLASPRAILADDVFSNLHDKEDFISRYRRLAEGSGIDLLFTTQDEEEGKLAGHFYVMNNGTSTRVV
jgi:molybdate/tungstate transport system ATP-binding protein